MKFKNNEHAKNEDSGLLIIASTVPETITSILKFQPRHLASIFHIAIVTSSGKKVEEIEKNEGVLVYPIDMHRGISIFADIVSICKMTALFWRLKPLIIHSYTPKAGLVCMLSGFIARVPIRIHTFTGLIFPTSSVAKRLLLLNIDRLVCASATHVVPEGEGVLRDLQVHRVTSKRLKIIGSGNIAGVDTERFDPDNESVVDDGRELRKSLGIDEGVFVFCYIGRLNPDKGLRELHSAFCSLPPTSHLLIAGDIDKSSPIDNTLYLEMKSNNRIHLLGLIADVRPILSTSDILVLPSYREGFPNVLLEASAMKVPSIASNINGCNEIVEEAVNGWLVPPKDAVALMAAMECAMDISFAERDLMGQNARAKMKKKFEKQEYWQNIVEFYSSLLSSKMRSKKV